MGKEWDPVNWDRDIWEEPDKDGDVGLLNSAEITLPDKETSPPSVAEALLPKHLWRLPLLLFRGN